MCGVSITTVRLALPQAICKPRREPARGLDMSLALIAAALLASGPAEIDTTSADAAREAWFACVDRNAKKLSSLSSEGAEALAATALAGCARDERKYWKALVDAIGIDGLPGAQWLLQLDRGRARDAAIAVVVLDRLRI